MKMRLILDNTLAQANMQELPTLSSVTSEILTFSLGLTSCYDINPAMSFPLANKRCTQKITKIQLNSIDLRSIGPSSNKLASLKPKLVRNY